jgi:DNA-binding transcriptional regulator YiaG
MKRRNKTTAAKLCPRCEKGKLRIKVATRDIGPLLGLIEVNVKDLPAPTCDECDAVLIPGRVLDDASLAIAGDMLTQSELEPIEVKFLRKLLSYTQGELGEHLDVDRATVNRWEQPSARLGGTQCYALRSLVFVQLKKKAGSMFDRAEQALREHSVPRPKIPSYRNLDAARLDAA